MACQYLSWSQLPQLIKCMSGIFRSLYFVDAQTLFPAAVARYKESIDAAPDRDPIFTARCDRKSWVGEVVTCP